MSNAQNLKLHRQGLVKLFYEQKWKSLVEQTWEET